MTESLKIYCNSCKRHTNHEILKIEERKIDDDEAQVVFYDSWQIIKCLGCEDISFRQLSSNSDDYDSETGEHFESVCLYPNRNDKTLPIKSYYNVPLIVRNIYRETLEAYNNGLYLLCAAGLRAIIESICAHEKITSGLVEKINKNGDLKIIRTKDLQGKINGLLEKGIITKKQETILNEHRYLGNDAVHKLDKPHSKILTIAIEIIEQMLDLLYEIDQKTDELLWHREQKENRKR